MRNLYGQSRKLQKQWVHAQDVHAKEHEAGISTTLSCNAVGHMPNIDEYLTVFDKDAARKFQMEYRVPSK